MSIPDDTPAEVMTCPWSTYRGPDTSSMRGYSTRVQSVHRQCVVARRPSSKPAEPRKATPVHDGRPATHSQTSPTPHPQTRIAHPRKKKNTHQPTSVLWG